MPKLGHHALINGHLLWSWRQFVVFVGEFEEGSNFIGSVRFAATRFRVIRKMKHTQEMFECIPPHPFCHQGVVEVTTSAPVQSPVGNRGVAQEHHDGHGHSDVRGSGEGSLQALLSGLNSTLLHQVSDEFIRYEMTETLRRRADGILQSVHLCGSHRVLELWNILADSTRADHPLP